MSTTTTTKTTSKAGPRLRSEVRTYTVSMDELSQWLTGAEGFRVTGFEVDDFANEIIVELSNAPVKAAPKKALRPPSTLASAVERAEPGPQITDEPREDEWLAEDGDAEADPNKSVDDVPSQIPERVAEARSQRARRV